MFTYLKKVNNWEYQKLYLGVSKTILNIELYIYIYRVIYD